MILDREEIRAACEHRFLAKVIKGDGPNDCWVWPSAALRRGYGRIRCLGRQHGAHRISYLMYRGCIPPGHFVCHSCDTPWCVNPAHLWTGTAQDNSDDCVRKGRVRYAILLGEENGMSKLSAEMVIAIRAQPRVHGSGQELATRFGVSKATICGVRSGRVWGTS